MESKLTERRCFFIAISWREKAMPKHFRALAQCLVNRGHQVVLFIDGQKKELEDLHANPATVVWPSPRPTKWQDALFLMQKIRQYQPDALVAHFGAVNLFSLLGWAMRVPVRVVWEHTLNSQRDLDSENDEWLRAMLRMRRRFIFSIASRIATNAQATALELQRYYHIPPSKILVFYNTIADPIRDTVAIQTSTRGQQKVVCAGRLDYSKGQDVLLRAMSYVRDRVPGVTLEIIGDGVLHDEYKQLARTLDLEAHVHFVGTVTHDQVLQHMAQAAITVVPSRSEAFGYVNIESMAVGTPVIASAVGGIPEIVRDGVDGYLVAPEDPRTLAQKLTTLLQNEALRAQMGRDARRRFLDCFEQSHMLERQVQWLEKLTTPSA